VAAEFCTATGTVSVDITSTFCCIASFKSSVPWG